MITAIRIGMGVAAFFLVLTFIVYGIGGFQQATAPFRGETEKREHVEANGDYRIDKYDQFHSMCNDIQAKNEQIKDAKTMLSGSKEKENVYALTQSKNEIVGDYNAMSHEDYTAGEFRDSDLPYTIDADDMGVECD